MVICFFDFVNFFQEEVRNHDSGCIIPRIILYYKLSWTLKTEMDHRLTQIMKINKIRVNLCNLWTN
jgi:hypothetical protein